MQEHLVALSAKLTSLRAGACRRSHSASSSDLRTDTVGSSLRLPTCRSSRSHSKSKLVSESLQMRWAAFTMRLVGFRMLDRSSLSHSVSSHSISSMELHGILEEAIGRTRAQYPYGDRESSRSAKLGIRS